MKIKMNMTNNFKLVPEGERVMTITKSECTPSGKPNKWKVTFEDSEGGFVNSQYDFSNDKSLFAMGKLLEVALDFEDGDEFDTQVHPKEVLNKKLLCKVEHRQGNDSTFANITRVISRIEEDTKINDNQSPRNMIANQEDNDYDL